MTSLDGEGIEFRGHGVNSTVEEGGNMHLQTHNRNTHLFRAVLRVLDCVWGTSSDRLSSVCTHAHKHMNKAGAESCTSISCVFNSSAAAAVMSLLCDETSLCRNVPFVLSRSPQTDAGSDFFAHVLPRTIKHLHDRCYVNKTRLNIGQVTWGQCILIPSQ